MNTWITILLIISCLAVTGVPQAVGYFGLTSRESLFALDLSGPEDLTGKGPPLLRQMTKKKICDLLKLKGRQKRMCQRNKGAAETLMQAVKLSVKECQQQFSRERWNCSLGTYRLNLIERGYRESSFLYAISSASLVHTVSKSCSRGHMTKCSCDDPVDSTESNMAWRWRGCGENRKFGLQFTHRFLRSKGILDLRGKVDKHNTRVGIKTVKDGIARKCKCHGWSGSCEIKTCWKQLVPFSEVGRRLKNLYENALKVDIATNGKKAEITPVDKNSKHRRTMKPTKLVYLEDSPNFCLAGKYSSGTVGRVCEKGSHCDAMCCGRGYNVKTRILSKQCHCKVVWCCKVKCDVCKELQESYLCK